MIFIKLYSIWMSNCFRKAKNAGFFFHLLSGSLWLNLRNIWFFIKGHYYGDICIHSWIIKDKIMCTKSDINSILQLLSTTLSRSSISRHETNSILRGVLNDNFGAIFCWYFYIHDLCCCSYEIIVIRSHLPKIAHYEKYTALVSSAGKCPWNWIIFF